MWINDDLCARFRRQITDDDQPVVLTPEFGFLPFSICKQKAATHLFQPLYLYGLFRLAANPEVKTAGGQAHVKDLHQSDSNKG